MPITVGIPGGGSPGYITTLQSSFGAIEIAKSQTVDGFQTIDIEADSLYPSFEAIEISNLSTQEFLAGQSIVHISTVDAIRTLQIVSGDSFLILADIIQEELSGATLGVVGQYEINARLRINGTDIGISSFSYQVPSGKLGSILNVKLANGQTISQVPAGAAIIFDLIVNGTTYNLLTSGKLQERDIKITYRGGKNAGPIDEITFGALDVIADKFTLSPRRPVIMYDPARVKFDEVNVSSENAMRDEQGKIIQPIIEPVYGLSMRQILMRGYTGSGGNVLVSALSGAFISSSTRWIANLSSPGTDQIGCDFDSIVTNIEDYKVRRADFTIENGWHDGAQPVVAMYAPIYFVEGNRLFIIDVDKQLPYGVNPHTIPLSEHKSLSEHINYHPDVNAVILTYQYAKNDPSEDPQRTSRDVFSDTVDSIGTRGTVGYTETTTRRWTREFYMIDDPDNVLDTLPLSSEVSTDQTIQWYDSATGGSFSPITRTTHVESIEYQYEGELNVGYNRNVQAAIANPASSFFVTLITVEREQCEIQWTDDPNNPGVKVQSWCTIETSGICVMKPDTETVTEVTGDEVTFNRYIPVLKAQQSGIIESDWELTSEVPIKTTKMTLHPKGGKQYDVEVIEIDHLSNTLNRSYTDPVTGGHPNNDPYEARSRTVLIRDLTSEEDIGPRIPTPVNAYELPRDRAFALAHRVLFRLQNPLQQMPVDLPGVDFAIARGSVVKGQRRSGYSGIYFVTGYSINGNSLGKQGHRIQQSLETTELLAQ